MPALKRLAPVAYQSYILLFEMDLTVLGSIYLPVAVYAFDSSGICPDQTVTVTLC